MIRKVVTYILCAVTISSVAVAMWEPTNGPDGGPTNFATTNPTNGFVFAIGNGAAYRSEDAGVTWIPLHKSIPGDLIVNEMASLGTNTYMWGTTFGIWRFYHSTDYGDNWIEKAQNGIPLFTYIHGIHISGANVLIGTSDEIYYSVDHGENWNKSTGVTDGTYVASFADFKGDLYAGSFLGSPIKAIYRSKDNGMSWTKTTTPWLDSALAYVTDLTANGNALFVGTGLTGVRRSTDSGYTWTKVNPGVTTDFVSSLIANSTNMYVCGPSGTIQRTDANGNNWTAVNTGLPPSPGNGSIPDITTTNGTVIAATPSWGIYRTTNSGASWSESSTGLRCSQINDVYSFNGNIYAASESDGFFRSMDAGDNWTDIDVGIPDTVGWYSFGEVDGMLLGGCGMKQIYRSANGGDTWTLGNTGLHINETHTFEKVNDDSLLAGGLADVYVSNDGAVSWTRVQIGIGLGSTVNDILVDGANMFITLDVGGYARSIDNGNDWHAVVIGLPGGSGAFTGIARLDTIWYVGTKNGVYKSVNKGFTWTASNVGADGKTVSLIAHGMNLYQGTDSGVYVSENGGATWEDFGAGFEMATTVTKLVVNGQYMYAGTDRFGVWRRSLVSTDVEDAVHGSLPEGFKLSQNFPNPFNPSSTIQYSIPRRSHVKIEIFNILGERVTTLVDETQSAGEHAVRWDGTSTLGQPVASGVYLYRFTAGEASQTRKMLLTK